MASSKAVVAAMLLLLTAPGCDDPGATAPTPTAPPAVEAGSSADAGAPADEPRLTEATLGSTRNVHVYEQCYLAGQPSEEDLKLAKESGIKTIINLRKPDELKYDEAAAARELGLTYIHLSFLRVEEMTDDFLDRARTQMADAERPVLVHCGSAGRVGALWLIHRALDDGLSTQAAAAEAREVGLRNAEMEARAVEYVQKHKPATK